ncbi:MAG: hypothetical protein QM831_42860 [Kofleriaceae bacterium]
MAVIATAGLVDRVARDIGELDVDIDLVVDTTVVALADDLRFGGGELDEVADQIDHRIVGALVVIGDVDLWIRRRRRRARGTRDQDQRLHARNLVRPGHFLKWCRRKPAICHDVPSPK